MSGHTPTQADLEAAGDYVLLAYGAETPSPAVRALVRKVRVGKAFERLSQAFAAHRIAACNSHGELVSALEAIASAEHDASIDPYNDHDLGYSLGLRDQARIARRALSKAKGEAL